MGGWVGLLLGFGSLLLSGFGCALVGLGLVYPYAVWVWVFGVVYDCYCWYFI